MSAAEFKAIQTLVRAGRKTAGTSGVWMRIHNATALGQRTGKQFVFTGNDVHALRLYAKTLTGLDPMLEDLSGDRIELAAKTNCEKLGNELVFGRMVVMATLGDSSIPLKSGDVARAPASVLMSTHLDRLDLDYIQKQKVLITENGTTIQYCGELVLPGAWADAIIVYRGHGDNVNHVNHIIQNQPSENLGFLGDFDPAGLDISTHYGKGVCLIPDPAAVQALDPATFKRINQKHTFGRQADAFRRLKAKSADPSWLALMAFMDNGRIAIMEEYFVADGLPLIVGPVFSAATGQLCFAHKTTNGL